MRCDEERSIVTEVDINREIRQGPFDPVTQFQPIRRSELESTLGVVTQSLEFPLADFAPRSRVAIR